MKLLEQKEQLIELRAKGFSYQAIAKKLSITKQTAINWAKELEIEIQNARAIELDALYDKHLMSKQSRIELLSEQLNKIKNELSKRSFDSMTTDKLLDMQIKILSVMREEKETLTLVTEYSSFDMMYDLTNYKICKIDN